MRRNQNPPLLVGVRNGAAAVSDRVAAPQTARYRLAYDAAIPRYIPKTNEHLGPPKRVHEVITKDIISKFMNHLLFKTNSSKIKAMHKIKAMCKIAFHVQGKVSFVAHSWTGNLTQSPVFAVGRAG